MAQVPEQVKEVDELEKFRLKLIGVSKQRIVDLAQQDEFEVVDKEGRTRTLKYHPLTVKEYNTLEDLSSELMDYSVRLSDDIKNAKPQERLQKLIAAKSALTKKAVDGLFMTSGRFFFRLNDEEFQTLPNRRMVELIAACRFREDNGHPNA